MEEKALYYASCAAGLEMVLLSEIETLKGTSVEATPALFGGVVFYTESSPEDVFKLRSADNVYAFLGHFKDLPVEKDFAVIYMESLASKINWDPALQLFWKWQVMQNREIDSPLSFRVTCERKCLKMKKHPFSSMDAAAALGEGVQNLHGWPADMRGYNVQVLGWIIDTELLVVLGLIYSKAKEGFQEKSASDMDNPAMGGERKRAPRPSRADAQLYSRRPYRKALVGTSLKPSVAYALLQLGHIQPNDIILDPMCGCGTIPLEAADYFREQVMCLGGDISSKAVTATEENTRGVGAPAQCDVVQWDASLMPMRTGCVDCVLCDMPFGVRCGSTQARDWLGPKVVQEIARVLKLGTGVAVLMSQGKAMKKEMESTPYFKLLKQLEVDMEGIQVVIYVSKRTLDPVQTNGKVEMEEFQKVFVMFLRTSCKEPLVHSFEIIYTGITRSYLDFTLNSRSVSSLLSGYELLSSKRITQD